MLSFQEIHSLFQEGQEQATLNNRQKALEIFSRIIDCKVLSSGRDMTLDWKKLLALTYNNRGHLRYLQVDFSDAVEDYTNALALSDTLTVAYYNRGLIHYRLGRFELAAEDQRRALALEPDFESAKQCLEQCEIELLKRQNAS